jgi:ketosteroid isomerase-like protein
MPRNNLEIVREMYERRERGDMDVAEFVDPEIEFARIGSDPDVAGEWRGLAGMRKANDQEALANRATSGRRLSASKAASARGARAMAAMSKRT